MNRFLVLTIGGVFFLLFSFCLVQSKSEAASDASLEQSLGAARQEMLAGRPERALDIYLESMGQLSSATALQRERLLRGLWETSQKLLFQNRLDMALRGMIALLPVSQDQALGAAFSLQVRAALEQTAETMVLGGQAHSALPVLHALMADSPGTAKRWAFLARAYLEISDFNKAAQTLQQGFRLFPQAPQLYFVRAALAGSLSEVALSGAAYASAEYHLQEAKRDLEQAISLSPREPGLHHALGKIAASLWIFYRTTGNYAKAQDMLSGTETAYVEAARLDPNDPAPLVEFGQLLFTVQDWNWGRENLRQALLRYQAYALRPDLTAQDRLSLQQDVDRCQKNIASTLHNQALDAINTAHFDFARRLAEQAARDTPAYVAQLPQVRALIDLRQQAFGSEEKRLRQITPAGDAQVSLGDLWLRAQHFEQAQAAFQEALNLPVKKFNPSQVKERLEDAANRNDATNTVQFTLGGLTVEMETPQQGNVQLFRELLEKAQSLAMGIFPHQLVGPLALKVFPNHRTFLEQAGPRLGFRQKAVYQYGRIMTYLEPHRSRNKWLSILLHEIVHRYLAEMTYGRGPSWLSEGLALWAAEPWSRPRQQRFHRLNQEIKPVPWREIDVRWVENWNESATLDHMNLQAQHMVRWFIEQFGFERMMTLLATLRQGLPIEQALRATYKEDLESLERRWLLTLQNPS